MDDGSCLWWPVDAPRWRRGWLRLEARCCRWFTGWWGGGSPPVHSRTGSTGGGAKGSMGGGGNGPRALQGSSAASLCLTCAVSCGGQWRPYEGIHHVQVPPNSGHASRRSKGLHANDPSSGSGNVFDAPDGLRDDRRSLLGHCCMLRGCRSSGTRHLSHTGGGLGCPGSSALHKCALPRPPRGGVSAGGQCLGPCPPDISCRAWKHHYATHSPKPMCQ